MDASDSESDYNLEAQLVPDDVDAVSSSEERKLISSQTQKKTKAGSFQSMGMMHNITRAIIQKGYKQPTPIQRKCIPPLLEGKDVVGMARTGSGKTAAFLLPLLNKLRTHSAKVGARAIVLSPSRELAMQTQKVCRELSKFLNLRTCLLVGGDNMEDQFSMIAANPDILIATPGRLLHLIVEMELDLSMVEFVVFDEADRLFEMGFAVQLKEILYKLPASRQTCLFSATLPKVLVEFASAGLRDPLLVRLDVDSKISQDLRMAFMAVKEEEKEAALLYLLRDHLKIPKPDAYQKYSGNQTIVFVSTKHHVEYIAAILRDHVGYDVSYIYGSLDQIARKEQIDNFRKCKTVLLVVTDVAARGIDIPILENVINYDFVGSSKVFVHRVGRAARAGRQGWAFSLLTHDDLPYFIDLQLFLSRQVIVGSRSQLDYTKDLIAGCIPRDEVQMDVEWITAQHESSTDLINQQQVVVNANKQFRKTRPKAAPASYKRAKELDRSTHLFNTVHPLLSTLQQTVPAERSNLLSSIANFRPRETIFEIGQRGTHKNNEAAQIVRKRRSAVEHVVQSSKKLKTTPAAVSIEEDVKTFKDEEYYMSHFPQDHNTEQGYAVSKNESFMENAQKVSMDLVDDERSKKKAASSGLHWDVKKKKFVRGDGTGSDNKKIIRTESGAKISASFQSGRFKDWQKKSKLSLPRVGEEELKLPTRMLARRRYQHTMNTPAKELDKKSMGYEKAQRKQRQQPAKSEFRKVQEIRKGREQKEKRRAKTGRHKKQKGKGGRRR